MALHFLLISNILYTCVVFLAKDVMVAATEATFKGAVKFSDGNFITYANFVPFYSHKLNHSMSESRMVKGELDCIGTCSDNDSCLSANFKTTPKANTKFGTKQVDKGQMTKVKCLTIPLCQSE